MATCPGASPPAAGRERSARFGRDGRLRATDSRTSGRRIFEEYRYDALGRRVWVRQRTQCEPTNDVTCASPFTRRTIWDGTQELAEMQAPYDSVATLEELDSGWPGPIRTPSMAGWCTARGWWSISR